MTKLPHGEPNTPVKSRVSVDHLLGSVAVGIAVLLAGWTALIWFRYHTHIPWRDIYLIMADVQILLQPSFQPGELAAWFDLHYSAHRIFIPRLLVALDVIFADGQNHLLYFTGWLSMLVLLLLFGHFARKYFRQNGSSTFFIALSAIALFSPAHLWNLLNPVNASWHITLAASAAAFAIVLSRENGPGKAAWLMAGLLASVAALSTFGGVITWLILPLIAIYTRSRYTPVVLLVCAALVYAYSQGIHSDAAIAVNWGEGQQELVEQLKQQGRDALTANTPLKIIGRTAEYFSWPLARNWPTLAMTLTLGSWLLVTYWGLKLLRGKLKGRARPHVFIELCLATAIACIAIAVATNLGRIVPRAVHVLGPSEERFQTVVLCYWFCVAGLALAAGSHWPQGRRQLLSIASLAIIVLLIPINSVILKEEILSMENAARLHSHGENRKLREPINKGMISFRPERIFKLDAFLAERSLAYHAPLELELASGDSLPDCRSDKMSIVIAAAEKPQMAAIKIRFHTHRAYTTRELLLSNGGRLVGRLYPVHTGDYKPLQLLARDYNEWRGHLDRKKLKSGAVIMWTSSMLGQHALCQLDPDYSSTAAEHLRAAT